MLGVEDIIVKTYALVDVFKNELKKGNGRRATNAYYEALTIACFCEFPEADKLKLFGDSTQEEPVEGLFDSYSVERAHNMANKQTMEHLRRQDEPIERYNLKFVYI